MQGNLNEIDLRSILQLIELGQRTGELCIEAYSYSSTNLASNGMDWNFTWSQIPFQKVQSWFIFFLNGQIVYMTDGDNSLSRLRDYLRRDRIEIDLEQITISALAAHHALEYAYLWALLEQHILTPAQGRSIIHSMTCETLFDLLSLHQGSFIFKHGSVLAPQLTTLEIGSLVAKIMQQVQEWKQLHSYIQSPYQYLAIADAKGLRRVLPTATVSQIEQWVDGKTSLRQLARYLNRDILTIGRTVYPFVKQGWMQVRYPTTSNAATRNSHSFSLSRTPKIICIDDAIAICKTVESILQQQAYEAIGCSDPLQAFSLVFHHLPDLILCDIVMPALNGYELCAMLRRSSTFQQTPIIMLTGKDQFIDRVRARMVGATDYLTKPFTDSELLLLVEKHLTCRKFLRPSA